LSAYDDALMPATEGGHRNEGGSRSLSQEVIAAAATVAPVPPLPSPPVKVYIYPEPAFADPRRKEHCDRAKVAAEGNIKSSLQYNELELRLPAYLRRSPFYTQNPDEASDPHLRAFKYLNILAQTYL
jgi:molybdenum cofactor biosynthesis enzyme MoaA